MLLGNERQEKVLQFLLFCTRDLFLLVSALSFLHFVSNVSLLLLLFLICTRKVIKSSKSSYTETNCQVKNGRKYLRTAGLRHSNIVRKVVGLNLSTTSKALQSIRPMQVALDKSVKCKLLPIKQYDVRRSF